MEKIRDLKKLYIRSGDKIKKSFNESEVLNDGWYFLNVMFWYIVILSGLAFLLYMMVRHWLITCIVFYIGYRAWQKYKDAETSMAYHKECERVNDQSIFKDNILPYLMEEYKEVLCVSRKQIDFSSVVEIVEGVWEARVQQSTRLSLSEDLLYDVFIMLSNTLDKYLKHYMEIYPALNCKYAGVPKYAIIGVDQEGLEIIIRFMIINSEASLARYYDTFSGKRIHDNGIVDVTVEDLEHGN